MITHNASWYTHKALLCGSSLCWSLIASACEKVITSVDPGCGMGADQWSCHRGNRCRGNQHCWSWGCRSTITAERINSQLLHAEVITFSHAEAIAFSHAQRQSPFHVHRCNCFFMWRGNRLFICTEAITFSLWESQSPFHTQRWLPFHVHEAIAFSCRQAIAFSSIEVIAFSMLRQMALWV